MRAGDFKYCLIQLFKQRINILISLQQLSLMQKCYDYTVYGTLCFIIPTQPEWTIKDRNQKKENVLSKMCPGSHLLSPHTNPVPAGETSQKEQAHITGAAHEQSV